LAAAYSDPFWKNLFDYKENDSYIWNIGIDIKVIAPFKKLKNDPTFNR